ncbi:S1 RNA-binding domain-containing protein [Aneurinibacillus thermoaerophilus]|uniref:S1 RNA-binding domain-containing protein n=1 Tax=Aneurinibacillus thermoaerophilus TaxID=143495 RepID=UPI002E1FA36D|nr:S1 RNA-binding domain-containing protein [Aneurinibacillus thermoaerophilus]MED0737844.1 S1 RNA-binding domain-containing protein [Aneurinibacillus thermoaerophilus]
MTTGIDSVGKAILAEGVMAGQEKKTFEIDFVTEVYAARQNGTILTMVPTGIEDHEIAGKSIPCLIVNFGPDMKGLLPLEYSGVNTRQQLRKMVGKPIQFKVTKIIRGDNDKELCLLDRNAAKEWMAEKTWKEIKEGDVRPAVVQRVFRKSALVDVSGIQCELPIKEVSWGYVPDISQYLSEGDYFDVKVTKVDLEEKKIQVSLRELLPKPWPDCLTRYEKGGEYLATVSGIEKYGIFLNLEPGVDALAEHMRFERPRVGQKVLCRVYRIDAKQEEIRARIIQLK